MDYEMILYEKTGRVVRITLNRPEKLNALAPELQRDIHAGMLEADADEEVRAIVLTGSGRAFSAGADIGRNAGQRDERSVYEVLLGWVNSGEAGFEKVHQKRRLHKPVIAALNGFTLGAGFELAITCDMLVASDQAVLGAPEIRFGSIVATILPHLVGPMWAKRIILTGDHITAQTAHRIGLVQQVVPHDQLLSTATELAERIAMVPPLAVRLNKRMIDGIMEARGIETGLSYAEMVAAVAHTLTPVAENADGQNLQQIMREQGMRAFLEATNGKFGRTPW